VHDNLLQLLTAVEVVATNWLDFCYVVSHLLCSVTRDIIKESWSFKKWRHISFIFKWTLENGRFQVQIKCVHDENKQQDIIYTIIFQILFSLIIGPLYVMATL